MSAAPNPPNGSRLVTDADRREHPTIPEFALRHTGEHWFVTTDETGEPWRPGVPYAVPGWMWTRLGDPAPEPEETERFDFSAHLARQRDWSAKTFGPEGRLLGVVDHIRRELREIEADPGDLREWIDVVILALDGAWRTGAYPDAIIAALVAKQAKNEAREWPDWRGKPMDMAIEHVRTPHEGDPAPEPATVRVPVPLDHNEQQAFFTANILRNWDRDRIEAFAGHLLGSETVSVPSDLAEEIHDYLQDLGDEMGMHIPADVAEYGEREMRNRLFEACARLRACPGYGSDAARTVRKDAT